MLPIAAFPELSAVICDAIRSRRSRRKWVPFLMERSSDPQRSGVSLGPGCSNRPHPVIHVKVGQEVERKIYDSDFRSHRKFNERLILNPYEFANRAQMGTENRERERK